MIQYIYGPDALASVPAPAPTPTPLAIVAPTIDGVDQLGVRLAYPAFEPATHQAPVESHAVHLTPGEGLGGLTAAELLQSGRPISTYRGPISVEGALVVQEHPAELAPGDYVVQTVLGYEVPDA